LPISPTESEAAYVLDGLFDHDRSFHAFEMADAYPALKEHIGAPVNAGLILECWDEIMHLAASISTRVVAPSAVLKQLAATANPSHFAKPLCQGAARAWPLKAPFGRVKPRKTPSSVD
jgi:TnpA family transposase